MKKTKLILFVFIFLICGCPDGQKFTVTFDPNGGTLKSPATVAVEFGKSLSEPLQPELNGSVFIGWFDKKSGGTQWNFSINRVTENITLYAQWKATRMSLSASE